jgi:hypothetical protein
MMAAARDPTLAEIHRQLECLPLLTGAPPKTWYKAIDVMIEKKAGNFQVDKLRAICLFDCIANHGFKHLGKCMMTEAEAQQLVAKEQGGSRKGHWASYIGLEKTTLSADPWHSVPMTREPATTVVHSVNSLSLQRVGVPKPAVVCMFLTIQKLEHYIRTIFGDSETYFGGEKDVDLYAVPMSTIGQGNGAGPQIWALVSTPILNMLRAEALGMAFRCTLSGEKVGFVGYSFVDDTDLGICGNHVDYLEVVEDMQRSMNCWEGGLRATGGAIAPEKTFWYLIDYKWTNGIPAYKSALECPAEISVKDMYGVVQTIRCCPVDHAEWTLGIYLAPDGNERTQESVLRKNQSTGLRHYEAALYHAP